MNILIIGGLLGLAVLAILGAVLLGIGEDRSEKAQKALERPQSGAPVSPPAQAQSRPATSQEGPAYQSVPATPLLSRQTVTLPVSSTGETTGSLGLADLNGQVREITSELHILAQRAGELQQRLTTLGETLERQAQFHAELPHSHTSADLFMSDTEETQMF